MTAVTARFRLFGPCAMTVLALLIGPRLGAEEKPSPHFIEGTVLEIGNYDAASDTYQIIPLEIPVEAPTYVRRVELLKVIPSLNTNRIRRNPDFIVSSQFSVDSDVPTLTEREVARLRKTAPPGAEKPARGGGRK